MKCQKKVLNLHQQQTTIFILKLFVNMVKGKKKIKGICFRQDSLSLIHGNVIHLYIACELDILSRDLYIGFYYVIACLEL